MRRGGSASGAVTIAMMFCVLCLALFSVMALSVADREMAMAEFTEKAAREYYEADRKAVIMASSSDGPTEIEVEVNGNLKLAAGIDRDGSNISVNEWRTEYSGSWAVDDAMDVWDGS